MNREYKTEKWLQTQAKTLETKCLKKHKKSYSFCTYMRMLITDAVIYTDEKGYMLDMDKYKENKKEIIKKYLDKPMEG